MTRASAEFGSVELGDERLNLRRVKLAAHPVRQQIRMVRVRLGQGKGEVQVTCIEAREIGTPRGQKPVCSRLLTNRGAHALDAASELIGWCSVR